MEIPVKKTTRPLSPALVSHRSAVLMRASREASQSLSSLMRRPYSPVTRSAEDAIAEYRAELEKLEGRYDELLTTCAYLSGAADAFGMPALVKKLEKLADELTVWREAIISEIVLCAGMQSISVFGKAIEPDPSASLDAAREVKCGEATLSDAARARMEELAGGLSLLAETFDALGGIELESEYLRGLAAQEKLRLDGLAGLIESVLETAN